MDFELLTIEKRKYYEIHLLTMSAEVVKNEYVNHMCKKSVTIYALKRLDM